MHLGSLEEGRGVVTGGEAIHLAQVLRVKPGSELRAFDGSGQEADGVVREVEADRVVVDLGPPRSTEVEAELQVTVAVSLLKGDKLSDVVRQCTELGAKAFRPLLASRRDVPVLSSNKLARLRRVAQEAAKQSGRSVVPAVHDPAPLSALELSGETLVAHPRSPNSVSRVAPTDRRSVTIITGPEGGLTDDEVHDLESRGAVAVGLGARVLRAETAPVALLAALLIPEAR